MCIGKKPLATATLTKKSGVTAGVILLEMHSAPIVSRGEVRKSRPPNIAVKTVFCRISHAAGASFGDTNLILSTMSR